MRLYKTEAYETKYGEVKKDIIFIVFNDDERETFARLHKDIIQVYHLRLSNNMLRSWNEFDREALYEILDWPKHYKDGGKMQDLTKSQVNKIMKMLNKLFDDDIDFINMFDLGWDAEWDEERFMTDKEMRLEQDRRRRIYSDLNRPAPVSMFSSLFDV